MVCLFYLNLDIVKLNWAEKRLEKKVEKYQRYNLFKTSIRVKKGKSKGHLKSKGQQRQAF